jgi:hypothetical protein
MKKASKKPAKKMKPEYSEYAGHSLLENVWFRIGLSKMEAKMLKTVAEKNFVAGTSSSKVARFLLQAALAHYDLIGPLLIQDERYCRSEGFMLMDVYMQGLVSNQTGKL